MRGSSQNDIGGNRREKSKSIEKLSSGHQKRGSISSKTGFLTKRAMSSMDAFANWKQRFFVLADGTLSYYKQGSGLFASSKDEIAHLKGEITLTSNTIVRKTSIDERVNCFEVITPTKKLYAQADCASEMNEWIDSIRSHVNYLRDAPNDLPLTRVSEHSGNSERSNDSLLEGVNDLNIPDAKTADPNAVNEFIKKLVDENKRLREQIYLLTQSIEEKESFEDSRMSVQKTSESGGYPSDLSLSNRPSSAAAVLDLREVRKKQFYLWDAAEEGKLETVINLLQEAVVDINGKGIDQWTALHLAASKNFVKVADTLLSRGAFVNARTSDRSTPLHLASKNGFVECVEMLLSHGADPNLTDDSGNGCVHVAAEGGFTNVVKTLIKHGAKIDAANASGSLPLHLAPIGHPIRVLLSIKDVDPNNKEKAMKEIDEELGKKKDVQTPSELNMPPTFRTKYEEALALGPRDFEFIKVLGRGAFAKVYLVRGKGKSHRNNYYALKAYNKKAIVQKNQARYILTEKNALQQCSTHPFIVTLHYSFQSTDRLFLVMDYCGGGDLLSALTRRKCFKEHEAMIYIGEIVLALSHLHSKNMVFRDLKPENVVLDMEGHALLTDFGISKEGIMDHSSASTFCGSPMYLAPEMLQRSGHGQPLDWYSVGALLYELMTGLPPYYTNDKKKLFHNILKGQLPMPDFLSNEAKSLMIGLLQRDPKKRLGSGPTGAKEIMGHPFFRTLDWKALYNRQIPAPYTPIISEKPKNKGKNGELTEPDLSNFPQAFTDQVISDHERGIEKYPSLRQSEKDRDRRLFKDFDFQPVVEYDKNGREIKQSVVPNQKKTSPKRSAEQNGNSNGALAAKNEKPNHKEAKVAQREENLASKDTEDEEFDKRDSFEI